MPNPRARLRLHQTFRARVGWKAEPCALDCLPPSPAAAGQGAGWGRGERAQSSRCGLDLGAHRSGGPGEAGLRANPAPFPATAWGCERSVLCFILGSSLLACDHGTGSAHVAALS